MNSEKLILVTNDDSVSAKGIHSLVEVAAQFGRVVVVAPDKPQSGMGSCDYYRSSFAFTKK